MTSRWKFDQGHIQITLTDEPTLPDGSVFAAPGKPILTLRNIPKESFYDARVLMEYSDWSHGEADFHLIIQACGLGMDLEEVAIAVAIEGVDPIADMKAEHQQMMDKNPMFGMFG